MITNAPIQPVANLAWAWVACWWCIQHRMPMRVEPPSGDPEATPRPYGSHPEATPRLPRGSTEATESPTADAICRCHPVVAQARSAFPSLELVFVVDTRLAGADCLYDNGGT